MSGFAQQQEVIIEQTRSGAIFASTDDEFAYLGAWMAALLHCPEPVVSIFDSKSLASKRWNFEFLFFKNNNVLDSFPRSGLPGPSRQAIDKETRGCCGEYAARISRIS